MTAGDQLLSALDAGEGDGLQTAMSGEQRLQMQMRLANSAAAASGVQAAPGNFSGFRAGVPNPNGRGLAAFEPNTVLGPAYSAARDTAAADAAKAAATAPTTVTVPGAGGGSGGGTPLGDATGKIGQAVSAALNMAARRVPYVWGGTSLNGADCSGMLYAVFQSAGIDTKRYRAVDYGHMGQEVSAQDARPGDIIYYDEPGNTDHVGLYIGNGKMVQAPQSGDVVKVSNIGKPTSIRRIFTDDALQTTAGPTGAPAGYSYNGRAYTPWTMPGSTITRPSTGTGGRMRAI